MFSNIVCRCFLYVLIYQFLISKSHQCGYTITNISQIVTGINITVPSTGFIPRSASATNLRIFFEYMDSFNSNPDAATIKRDIMEPARLSLQSAITVKNPINGVLKVDRQCIKDYRINGLNQTGCVDNCVATTVCANIPVPDKYLNKCKIMSSDGTLSFNGSDGAGEPNVDLVILVSGVGCPSGVIAYANACFQESKLDRPILGIINICLGMVFAGLYARDNIVVVKHEIIHVLGFAVDKFAFYRNPDGTPIVPRDSFGRPNAGISTNSYYNWNDKIIVQVNRTRSSVTMNYTKPFYALVLPNVVAVAREHFNCPSINEVELEDYGNMGSAFSHFDQYVLYNEFMNPVSFGWNQRFSKFTLALLKDTGWYDVDYSKAEPLDYGKNAGCILPQNGCYAYMESQKLLGNSIDPFCDVAYGQKLQCDPTRKYYQYCTIVEDYTRPPMYQYLKSVKGATSNNPYIYGGNSPYSEYCPMKVTTAYRYNSINSDCTDPNNIGLSNMYTPLASSYGPYSLCFDTTMASVPAYGATCLNYNYNGNSNNYVLCVGNQSVTCIGTTPITVVTTAGSAIINCISTSLLQQNNFGTPFTCSVAMPYPMIDSTTAKYSTTMIAAVLHRYSSWIFWITLGKIYFY